MRFSVLFSVTVFSAALHAQNIVPADSLSIGVYPVILAKKSGAAGDTHDLVTDSLVETRARELGAMLADAFQREQARPVVFPATIAHYLSNHRDFAPFVADSVQQLCQHLSLRKLVLPAIETLVADSGAVQRWRLMLRWLEATSGEMTKFLVSEFEVDPRFPLGKDSQPDSFDAGRIVKELLAAPEIILPQEPQSQALPELQNPPALETLSVKKSRWYWYLGAAAAIGGGSAYFLLYHEDKSEPSPALLPEPPEPPK